jgi:cytochrome c-type biogenesis protein CcsB
MTYALLWLPLLAYAVYLARGGRWTGRVATGLSVVAWAALTRDLVKRGLEAGHWPLTNRYEFALCFVWAILTVCLLLEASWRERRGSVFVLVMALLVATYAITRPADERTIAPLLPALRSVWLQIHVLTAAMGYGAFGVAAGLGLMLWVADVRERTMSDTSLLPPTREAERAIGRTIALGFPWLTLSILTGAIWAQKAWGRYWGWDPKETWALITWLWYLLILHVRPLRRWRGWRLATLTIAGFGLVLFTFIGVPWLVRTVRLESLHGF